MRRDRAVSGPSNRRCPCGREPAGGLRRRSCAPTPRSGGYGGRGGQWSRPWGVNSLRSRGFRDQDIARWMSGSGFEALERAGSGCRRGCLRRARALTPVAGSAIRSAPTKLGQLGPSVSTDTRTSYYLRRRGGRPAARTEVPSRPAGLGPGPRPQRSTVSWASMCARRTAAMSVAPSPSSHCTWSPSMRAISCLPAASGAIPARSAPSRRACS